MIYRASSFAAIYGLRGPQVCCEVGLRASDGIFGPAHSVGTTVGAGVGEQTDVAKCIRQMSCISIPVASVLRLARHELPVGSPAAQGCQGSPPSPLSKKGAAGTRVPFRLRGIYAPRFACCAHDSWHTALAAIKHPDPPTGDDGLRSPYRYLGQWRSPARPSHRAPGVVARSPGSYGMACCAYNL